MRLGLKRGCGFFLRFGFVFLGINDPFVFVADAFTRTRPIQIICAPLSSPWKILGRMPAYRMALF
jgi:hypothetical protein